MINERLRRYLIPGIAFQSVVIGGGYGTGREIVEYFSSNGAWVGLLSMVLTTVIYSVVCAITYEYARLNGTWEYQAFFHQLIGRFAVVYEIAWMIFMLIVLSVATAAVGAIARDVFEFPFWSGVLVMGAITMTLVIYGTEAIKKAFSVWSIALYGVFAVVFVWSFIKLGPEIRSAFLAADSFVPAEGTRNWAVAGVAYAGYNLSLIPALLYTLENEVSTRREAVWAGLLAGPIAMLPAAMFFVAMVGLNQGVLGDDLPSNTLLEALGSRPMQIAFQIVLLGTLIETSVGMIQAVNARLGLGRSARPARVVSNASTSVEATGTGVDSTRRRAAIWALGWLGLAAFFARFGLIDLIAQGYGTVTWVFIVVYVVPVVTVGLWSVVRGRPFSGADEGPDPESRS
jgi:uncharacterized membrane protein YkvI